MEPPLLGVAALQLETPTAPTAANLGHVEALLDRECARLGVRRYDGTGAGGGSSDGSMHLDILVLPEIFNTPYLLNEGAWYGAEGLQEPARSPSLRALSAWAARYRCYVAATLLEATPESHIYNSLVLATPGGGFVRPGGEVQHGGSDSGGGGGGGGGAALVRKQRAASLEGFVFCSAGAPGRGGEPAAHVVEVDTVPLLEKRGDSGSGQEGRGGGDRPGQLRLAFAICYENILWETMDAILGEHRREPIDLLVAPFCAMAASPDHPTFGWPRPAAERLAAATAAAARLHSIKLRAPAVAAHHTGPWASPLPRLLPLLRRDPVPLRGPMLGCSAVYGPGGVPLAQPEGGGEGLALAHLQLLQRPRPPAAAHAASASAAAGPELAAVVGAAAAAAADAGPAAPYARYAGGLVIEPAGWQVRWGFPLMEALGWLYYHGWGAPLRRRVARAIAAQGTWQGPPPALEQGGSGWRWAAVAAAAAAALAVAVLKARHT